MTSGSCGCVTQAHYLNGSLKGVRTGYIKSELINGTGVFRKFRIGSGSVGNLRDARNRRERIQAMVPIVCLTEITSIPERCSVVPLREPHASVEGSYS